MSQISIKEARKMLGKDFEELDDIKIQEIIDVLSLIAKETLEKAASGDLKEFADQQDHHSNAGTDAQGE